jgi:hypothetical protein
LRLSDRFAFQLARPLREPSEHRKQGGIARERFWRASLIMRDNGNSERLIFDRKGKPDVHAPETNP